jgi:isoquinoline 1-oxidoreductase beta subunit
MFNLKRRYFVLGAVGAVGALVVGWSALPARERLIPSDPLPTAPGQAALNGWVKVSVDNTVTLVMSQSEMGQGVHTSLAMLLADEMEADWAQIRFEQSGDDPIYNNLAAVVDSLPFQPDDHGVVKRASRHVVGKLLREIPGLNGTGGSSSVNDQWLVLRQAGASARLLLIAAAADRWRVPAAECHAEAGRVLHTSGRSASFGELAPRAAQLSLPTDVALKEPSQFKLIGRPVPRIDNAAKVNGSAMFGIDALPPGLLYASATMCPTLGGKVTRFDAAATLKLSGVRKVVSFDPVGASLVGVGNTSGGVAVIADTPYHAMRAIEKVTVEWDHGPAAAVSSQDVAAGLALALDSQPGKAHFETGDLAAALKSAARTLDAEYRVPMLAHATMEPMNCTVQFKDGSAMVWAATQAPGGARAAVAEALGIKVEKVTLIVPYLGGGFGRRYFTDFLVQAAVVARQADGAPVQLLWSREQDMTHDFYRPIVVSRHRAGLDSQGRLVAWQSTGAGPSMGVPGILQGALLIGAYDTGYAFPNARIAYHASESPLPAGIWRSVAHSQNAFFTESFIDEVAAAAGQDPVAFRITLLTGNPRMTRVLRRAAELSGWGQPLAPLPDGTRKARGIGLHRAFGSVIAQVVEVSIGEAKQIRVHRVVCVLDCGLPVNPNLIRQQIEGGLIYGLSAALHGEITVDKGQVQQSNFHDYPPIRMRECPAIEMDIIASNEHPQGVGEVGTPPIAPAVANAVFALTGQRLRSLPLKLA